jgi:hypothetical protein
MADRAATLVSRQMDGSTGQVPQYGASLRSGHEVDSSSAGDTSAEPRFSSFTDPVETNLERKRLAELLSLTRKDLNDGRPIGKYLEMWLERLGKCLHLVARTRPVFSPSSGDT